MKRQIKLRDTEIRYVLKTSRRARRMRLAVYCDGSVVATMPYNFKEEAIEKFISEKTRWLLSKINFFKQFQGKPVMRYTRRDYLEHRKDASCLIRERVAHFSEIYGYGYKKIYIKNQKTRWGSCSKKGNLNFNYRILFLPEKLRDYIIVHEICHLKEFNHSKKFWSLVGEIIPDYSERRKELKKIMIGLQ